jgi:hypothetical protein
LLAPSLVQPGGNRVIAIGELLEIDAFIEGDRLTGANPLKDVLQPQSRRWGEHGQHSSGSAVIASSPELVV